MKISRHRLLVIMVLTAVACTAVALRVNGNSFSLSKTVGASSPIEKRENGIEAEEYAVYSVLINANGREGDSTRLLVIEEQPSPWVSSVDEGESKFYEEMKKDSPALLAETVDNLRAKNKENFKFTRNFNINGPYALISDEEVKSFFKAGAGGGWKAFYEKYPKSGGIVTFSRVGFNAGRTQALVYQGYKCGGLCGGGVYYLLSKKNGVWIVDGNVGPSWVS